MACGLLPVGSRVGVAFSGGPDSMCLLHMLVRLGREPVALHLDHGQREEAEGEARRLAAFCDSLDVAFVGGKADVPTLAKHRRVGIEEAGRIARYEFIRQAAARTGCDLVATGHTRDDLVETVLFNLVRGTGLAGLAGIPSSRDGIVRPLLPFTRGQTRTYCHEAGLPVLEDPSNLDLAFSRVRLRLLVVPELEHVHAGASANIARAAETVREEDAFLDSMAAAALEKCEVPLNGPLRFLTMDREVAFDRGLFNSHPATLRRRAVRLAAGVLGASPDRDFTFMAADSLVDASAGSMSVAESPVRIIWDSQVVRFERTDKEEPFHFNLVVPGVTESDVFGWQITARPWEPTSEPRPLDNLDVLIDADAVMGRLYFRSVHPSMKLTPLGMRGSKSAAQLMAEAKLTRLARERLPVVCDMVGAVWVPGCRIAERVKIADTSTRAFRLQFGPLDDAMRHEGGERDNQS